MALVTVWANGNREVLQCAPGVTVKDFLVGGGIYVDAPCGGNGKCGKCVVKAVGHLSAPSEKEISLGLPEGLRLACVTKILGDAEISVGAGERDMEISLGGVGNGEPAVMPSGRDGLGAAIDIGTTTVVCRLFDLADGGELGAKGELNLQRSFGADVISRIGACRESKEAFSSLVNTVRTQIKAMISELCTKAGKTAEEISYLCVAGNTTMAHLFCGLDPSGLGSVPFTPVSLFGESFSLEPRELGSNAEVYVLPASASFVGGDITAAALSRNMDRSQKTELLIDIGTNGEIVLCHGGKLWCCATAAGPAFEGADISCGCGGIKGAVRRADVSPDGELVCEVIGGGEAFGICGSGLVDALAVMLKLEALEYTGRMLFPDEASGVAARYLEEDGEGDAVFRLSENVTVTAADVRKLQLAKAAIAAGAKTLLDKAGISPCDVENLWLAGGFGNSIRVENAALIGLIPSELAGRAVSVGNAAMTGACEVLLSGESRRRAESLAKNMEYIELSADPVFMEYYVEEMLFGEE